MPERPSLGQSEHSAKPFEDRYDVAQERYLREPTRENLARLDRARVSMQRARQDERRTVWAQAPR